MSICAQLMNHRLDKYMIIFHTFNCTSVSSPYSYRAQTIHENAGPNAHKNTTRATAINKTGVSPVNAFGVCVGGGGKGAQTF